MCIMFPLFLRPPLPPPPPRHTRRILVIILSETRASRHTFSRFKQHVLDHLDADLALCVADPIMNMSNPFYTAAKYIWSFPDLSDWGDAYELAYRTMYPLSGGDWRSILSVKDQFMGGVKNCAHKGSAGILLFMRWWLQQQVPDSYDWYIVTRSDYYYLHPHPQLPWNNTENIWIVEGEDYGGVTDRHAVLPRQHLHTWLEFVDTLMKDPVGTIASMRRKRPNDGWNLETLLQWRLEELGVWEKVKRFKQVMFTVRDEETRTRWNKELGLYIKYPDEYKRAISEIPNRVGIRQR
jgi:hypothetical protein